MTLLSLALTAALVGTRAHPAPTRTTIGAQVRLVLEHAVTTRTAKPGDPVRFHTADDVVIHGVLIPRGAFVAGAVVRAKRAGRIRGRSDLAIGDLAILSPDGTPLASSSTVITALPRQRARRGFYARQTDAEGAVLTGMAAGYGAAWLASQWSNSEETVAGAGLVTGAAAIALVKILPRGEDLEILPGGTLTMTFTPTEAHSTVRR